MRLVSHRFLPGVVLLALAGLGTPALGHQLEVFAFADGARIEGQARFGHGATAAGARIVVQDAKGKTLAELSPAGDGGFAFEARAPVDHVIVAMSGDGHRAEWRVTASELAGGFPLQESAALAKRAAASAPPVTPAGMTASAGPAGVDRGLDPTLEAAIERAVARQVRPLREDLIAARGAIRMQDVLGGIGYILGLAGVGLWWRSRRLGDSR